MAKKVYKGSFINFVLLLLKIFMFIGIFSIIILVISLIIQWILSNVIPILILLIIIGSLILIYKWNDSQKKKKQDALNSAYIKEQNAKQSEFEELQTKLGLFKFIDRFEQIKWGSVQEIELWKTEDEAEKLKDALITKIVDTIIRFKPIRKWENEDGYHKELLGYLRHDFPDIKYEFQKGSSRPDLVFKNIAIELKGPTDNAALDTLTTKCLKYSKYYDHLIIVLFEPRFSERHFQEIHEGINQYFPHVIIIRK
jgi:hypothetical protein